MYTSFQLLTGGFHVPNMLENDLDQAGPSNATKDFSSWLAEFFPDNTAGTAGAKKTEQNTYSVDRSIDRRTHQGILPSSEDGAYRPSADNDDNHNASNHQRRVDKRGKAMSDAAVSKAHREKARRDRLNSYFQQLADVCDPNGKGPMKADKLSIVTDAIRVVQQLRVENNQLKQLNKFLEERMRLIEMSRGQAMYMAAQMQQQQQVTSMAAQMMSIKQDGLNGGMPTGALGLPVTPGSGMPWLPAPDINQDQKLRPPAA